MAMEALQQFAVRRCSQMVGFRLDEQATFRRDHPKNPPQPQQGGMVNTRKNFVLMRRQATIGEVFVVRAVGRSLSFGSRMHL
jgi:hypothetical protein